MIEGPPAVRLRQAVLVAEELEPLAWRLGSALGLEAPFRDPGVGEFGLANVVFAIGDCFREVISPTAPATAASRHLQRTGGDGGYMVLFDLQDLDGARARARKLGVRIVWQIDLPDIAGTHLHPADMRGAIVSLDRSDPYGSWRWGGPDWTGQVGRAPAGRLAGLTVAVADPHTIAKRWGDVLGVEAQLADEDASTKGNILRQEEASRQEAVLRLDGAEVRFRVLERGAIEGIVEIALQLPAEVRAGRE